MDLIVSKFGGTSVANASQIEKAASIVRSDQRRRCIVVSAPGKRSKQDEKITDILIACHAMAAKGEDFSARFAPIRKRFQELADQLNIGRDMDPWIDEVEADIRNGADSSAVVSRGEYLGAHMIARYLEFEFVDAAELIRFSDATTIDRDATDALVRDRLDPAKRYVIPGFYGARDDGSVQLFTRGGSDISAALVARGLGAVSYENWTDVSGLLSADPRLVENPDPVPRVSYSQLRELAFLGAQVFHDEAVAPVADAGIPINIRNTNEPDHPGTVIGPVESDAATSKEPVVTGVAGKVGYTGIRLYKSMLNKESAFPASVYAAFAAAGSPVVQLTIGGDSALAIVSGTVDASKLQKVVESTGVDGAGNEGALALVGAARPGIAREPAVAAAVLARLAQDGLSPLFIGVGYSADSVLFAVAEDRYVPALQAVYEATR